jgi:hypothetical protein
MMYKAKKKLEYMLTYIRQNVANRGHFEYALTFYLAHMLTYMITYMITYIITYMLTCTLVKKYITSDRNPLNVMDLESCNGIFH